MSLRFLRGALAPSQGYVCLQCRLYNTSIKIYRTRQSQITLIQSTCSAAKRILTDIRATKKAFCTSTKVSDDSVKLARARIARRFRAKSLGRIGVGRKSKSSQDVGAIVQNTDIRQGHEDNIPPSDQTTQLELLQEKFLRGRQEIALKLKNHYEDRERLEKIQLASPIALDPKQRSDSDMLKSKSNQNKNSDDISSKLRFEDIKELLNKRKKVAKNDDILVKKSNAATKASKLAGVKKKSKSKVRLILSERMAEKKAEKSTAALESTRSSHKSGVVNLEDAVKNAVQENDGTFETIVRNVITSAPASVRRPLRSKTSGVSSPQNGTTPVARVLAEALNGNPNRSTVFTQLAVNQMLKGPKKRLAKSDVADVSAASSKQQYDIQKVKAENLRISSIDVEQAPTPSLSYGLERVLFNPGVYQLQDPRTRVFNFDPYLQTIMPVAEFDFDALKKYITSSQDDSLKQLAKDNSKRYVGSSSSMTGVLAHFHFLLSQWREINIDMLSRKFPDKGLKNFTELYRSPNAIILRWQNGVYAIDADKQFASSNILSMLGKSMEKLLTLNTQDYEKYRKSNPEQVSSEEIDAPETYHYSTMGDFLMRAQLDAQDSRLPGTGTFDLKTRAVVSVRMDSLNYERGVGYQIKSSRGEWESYEREYFDMIRSAFLKYSLQVRMGNMDGIFVAYHNVERIFGFQYISLSEMDLALHQQEDTSLGDQEFKLSLELMNKVLDEATKKYPETSLRIHFETRDTQTNFMYIFVEPVTEAQVDEIQSGNNARIEEIERKLLGHDDSESQEGVGWADLTAGVQAAIAEDEVSVINADDDQANAEKDYNEGQESRGPKAEEQEQEQERNVKREQQTVGQDEELGEEDVDEEVDRSTEETREDEDYNETGHIDSHSTQNDQGPQLVESQRPDAGVDLDNSATEESITKADSDFLDSIAEETPSSAKPEILAMTLTIRNKVNDKYTLRPNALGADDRWEVEYSLTEVPSQERAWSLYRACQVRRQKKLEHEPEDEDSETPYIQMLRKISQNGAEWRRQMDEQEKERPRAVIRQTEVVDE